MNFRNLSESELNSTVWRYMPFSKFISILTYQALWFSKLNILQDGYEGIMPPRTKEAMNLEYQKHKAYFNTPEFHKQIDQWADTNEADGRELLVVNCWFFGERESERMWKEYVSSVEGVAIKSTPKRLSENVMMLGDNTRCHIGKVRYVDHSTYEMNAYEASQAIERAYIKDQGKRLVMTARLLTNVGKVIISSQIPAC